MRLAYAILARAQRPQRVGLRSSHRPRKRTSDPRTECRLSGMVSMTAPGATETSYLEKACSKMGVRTRIEAVAAGVHSRILTLVQRRAPALPQRDWSERSQLFNVSSSPA